MSYRLVFLHISLKAGTFFTYSQMIAQFHISHMLQTNNSAQVDVCPGPFKQRFHQRKFWPAWDSIPRPSYPRCQRLMQFNLTDPYLRYFLNKLASSSIFNVKICILRTDQPIQISRQIFWQISPQSCTDPKFPSLWQFHPLLAQLLQPLFVSLRPQRDNCSRQPSLRGFFINTYKHIFALSVILNICFGLIIFFRNGPYQFVIQILRAIELVCFSPRPVSSMNQLLMMLKSAFLRS